MPRGLVRIAIGVCLIISFSAAGARAATTEEIDKALAAGQAWLWTQAKDDSWDPGRPVPNHQDTGYTALAVYTLLASGVSLDDPRIQASIAYLMKHDTQGVYALGMREIVWTYLKKSKEKHAAIAKDYELLKQALMPDGHYHYLVKNPDANWDHSTSQIAVLGMWAAEQEFPETPQAYWKKIEDTWKADQNPDGGWNYQGGDSTCSMTAAGVATLFITQDFLHSDDGINCGGNIQNVPIQRGLKWIASNLPPTTGQSYYGWYGTERIGVASGYKYIGNHDWYAMGADYMLKNQQQPGVWYTAGSNSVMAETCFAMLFLARGRAPVVMNKLQYDDVDNTDTHWNERPRDCANVTKYIAKETEGDFNWQIVNLQVTPEELHDSPILYLAGDDLLKLTKENEDKLRAFVQEGGTIVGNPDCRSRPFENSFRSLGEKLFPGYKFKHMLKDNVLFNKPMPIRKFPDVSVLSNGARDLMFVLSGDPAQHWQTRSISGDEAAFMFMENLYLSLSKMSDPLVKGKSYWVSADAAVHPASVVHVARLKYTGNWDPEPGGWKRFGNAMHNANTMEVVCDAVDLGTGKLAYPDYKVAHLTGTAAFTLKPAERDELKKFTQAGGTLIVDAAGGSGDFKDSIETELAAIFPNDKLALLPSAHPVLNEGGNHIEIAYRPAAKAVIGHLESARLRGIDLGGRTAVFVSGEDLSIGLLGGYYNNVIGYESATAAKLMANMLQYAVNPAPLPPPGSGPASASAPAGAPSTAPAATPQIP